MIALVKSVVMRPVAIVTLLDKEFAYNDVLDVVDALEDTSAYSPLVIHVAGLQSTLVSMEVVTLNARGSVYRGDKFGEFRDAVYALLSS